MRLNAFGELLLTALALALHRFGGVQVLAMDVRPHVVEMVVVLKGWRLKLHQVIDRLNAHKILEPARRWLRFRRTQTIPLFMGYVKTNSARRINAVRGTQAPVWKRRYKAAVLTAEEDIRELCERLDASYATIRFPAHQRSGTGPVLSLLPAITSVVGEGAISGVSDIGLRDSPENGHETFLLGRVFLLMGRMFTSDSGQEDRGQTTLENRFAAPIPRSPAARIRTVEIEGYDHRRASGRH